MLLRCLLFILFTSVGSLKILVYSPAFGGSHTNFMARLADVLTEAGHNVTFLVPVGDEARKNQLGVKLTKNVVVVERDEHMINANVSEMDHEMKNMWLLDQDPDEVSESFKFFEGIFLEMCANLMRNKQIFDELKSRHFDVGILEPISYCGLGYINKLGIDKTILASSTVMYDNIPIICGEDLEPSHHPSLLATSSDDMNIIERYHNWRMMKINIDSAERMFNKELEVCRQYFGDDMPHWRDLFPAASIMFTNSNPFMDFPRPMLAKTVPIGGISVQLNKIREAKLDDEWDEVLNRRPKTVLVSFGSMTASSDMPNSWRENMVKVFESMKQVTFIWKYETDDLEFAKGADNIYFSKWVPQPALLADHRLSAFLTHGGLGSSNELAYCGKPAILVPLFGDQYRNAKMLARHEGSIIVKKTDLENSSILKDALIKILHDDSYTKHAQHLAEQLEHQPVKPNELLVKYTEFVGKMKIENQFDFKSKWALIVSVPDVDEEKRQKIAEFSKWFMEKLQYEGSQIGHHFNYEALPTETIETIVNDLESCTNAYRQLQKQHPQVTLVIHLLPQLSSNEYEWMKLLSQRYGLLRQGVLFENAMNRFENVELSVEAIFRNMCHWIYRSGLAMVRGNNCGLLIGEGKKPTFDKVLFNSDDIRYAVTKGLHSWDLPVGNECESAIMIAGFPDILNSFGVAQLLAPFRVINVTMNGPREATVTLENKFQAYQAARVLNGKQLSRNDTLSVEALGKEVSQRLAL
ncbi:unnamed protein product [Caenorhabditis bovis]|uniref:glucuronosyltransferase n=1 Tax=Caenorhabditis bovis TaxID=2654633 RepID=A0A8S1FE37_9PELO|nr:unnamed protein product [Caenorhabditis bovis]